LLGRHDLTLGANQEITSMTSFFSLHAAAAARGDGLRPELLALVVGIAPDAALTPRPDGMIQAGPDPAPAKAAAEPANRQISGHHVPV
jgi:hypothetical protein